KSAAYRQAARILAVCRAEIKGRPVTPLHGGHVALCAIAGLLDGVFGSGEDRHIATWRSVKVTDCSEEVEEDGTIIRRERERFTNELILLYASGETHSTLNLSRSIPLVLDGRHPPPGCAASAHPSQ